MLSLNGSLQLPHCMSVLPLHHNGQLFTWGGILAMTSRPRITVYCTVQGSRTCMDLRQLEIIFELIETCVQAVLTLTARTSFPCLGMGDNWRQLYVQANEDKRTQRPPVIYAKGSHHHC